MPQGVHAPLGYLSSAAQLWPEMNQIEVQGRQHARVPRAGSELPAVLQSRHRSLKMSILEPRYVARVPVRPLADLRVQMPCLEASNVPEIYEQSRGVAGLHRFHINSALP